MRTSNQHAVKRGLVAALAVVLGLSLAACSKDAPATDTKASDTGVTSINKRGLVAGAGATPEQQQQALFRLGTRPDPIPGLVVVDGALDSLTDVTKEGYKSSGDAITDVAHSFSGETRAFQRLCVGEIDIVDSSRPITPAEWASCRAQGLDVVQFQVAADAVVLGIKNETDIGTDCLSTDEVRTIFEAGSTINNWSQVRADLFDVPLKTGGPDIDSDVFQFFGRYVLDAPEPSITNFRSDYRSRRNEDDTRAFVVGNLTDQLRSRNLARVTPKWQNLQKQLRQAWAVWGDARDELVVALAERTKGVRTGRSAADQAADEQRVQDAYTAKGAAITKVNFFKAKFKPVNARYRFALSAQRRLDSTNGSVGLFRESYYAVYENLIRPFEIEVSDGDNQQDCIFPSPQTIVSGEYPLSRQLLLTTTTRALKRPEVQSFLRYYLRYSQVIAADQQVIALPNKDVQRQIDWISQGPLPTFASVDGGPVQIVTTPTDVTKVTTLPVEKPAR